MDGEGPENGQVHKILDPFGRFHVIAFGLERRPADDGVEDQITQQHRSIPEHDGIRRGMQEHVQHALRLPHVHHDEQHAHDDCADGEEFPEDDHPLERLVVVEIGRQNQHDRTGGHPDQIRELRDVKAPGDIAGESGNLEAEAELKHIDNEGIAYDAQQKAKPEIKLGRTLKHSFEHGVLLDEVVDAGSVPREGLRRML